MSKTKMEWIDKVLWMAGRITVFPEWEVIGVFSDEEKATKACKTSYDFIGVFVVNESFSRGACSTWPNRPHAYYPLADGRRSEVYHEQN